MTSDNPIRKRIAILPDSVRRQLVPWIPKLPFFETSGRVIVTGLGSSAGNAVYLASVLNQYTDIHAQFVPASSIVCSQSDIENLILFSQALSPNALAVLRRAGSVERVLLITSRAYENRLPIDLLNRYRDRLEILPLEVDAETGLLVRIIGPFLGHVAALQIANACLPRPLWSVSDITQCLVRPLQTSRQFSSDIVSADSALIVAEFHPEYYENIRLKLVEGYLKLGVVLIGMLDYAHGYAHAAAGKNCVIINLMHSTRDSPGWKLRQAYEATIGRNHACVTIESPDPPPLATLVYELTLNQLLADSWTFLKDLHEPVTKSQPDMPLYSFGGDASESRSGYALSNCR